MHPGPPQQPHEPPHPTSKTTKRRRRPICSSCSRPEPVCLCHVIPSPPVQTATRILIVQHPHESKHKVNTTALLTKSLLNATSFVSRRIGADDVRRLTSQSPSATSSVSGCGPCGDACELSDQGPIPNVSVRDGLEAGNLTEFIDHYATSLVLDGDDDVDNVEEKSREATSLVLHNKNSDSTYGSRWRIATSWDNVNVNEMGDNTSRTEPIIYYLFPPSESSPAVKLSEIDLKIKSTMKGKDEKESRANVVLIAFDATWGHAKEMVKASQQFLHKFAVRVCLDEYDVGVEGGNIYNSDLLLRKEPFCGCVTTLEAVARWIGVVEENGPEIEERLIRVLKEMVRLQARFLKPINPRIKMGKKGKFKPDQQNTDEKK